MDATRNWWSGSRFRKFSNLARDGWVHSASKQSTGLDGGRLEQVFNLVQQGELSFKGNYSRDLNWFPKVKFHFVGGADLVLDTQNLFYQVRVDACCMVVLESDMIGFSVIGVVTQQNYNVAYDLANYKLYFQK